jgi:hypothetical protein
MRAHILTKMLVVTSTATEQTQAVKSHQALSCIVLS